MPSINSKWPSRSQTRGPDWNKIVQAVNEAPHALALSEYQPAPPTELSSTGTILIDNRSLASDVIDALPVNAAKKLRELRQAWSDFSALAAKAGDAWNEAHVRKNDAHFAHLRLVDRDTASRFDSAVLLPADAPQVIAAKAALDRAILELQHATDLRDARTHRAGQVGPIVRNCESYLKSFFTTRFTEHPPIDVDLKRSETVTAALARHRKNIATLRANLHTIKSAPLLSSAVKARARAEINGLAQQGRPNVFDAIEAGERIQWPDETIRATTILHALLPGDGWVHTANVNGIVDTKMPSTMQVIAWLFKDRLIEAIESEIDSSSDDANALSDADRATKLSATLSEILETERQEEALIEMAAANGQEIGRRPEADPRAILGIEGPPPKQDH